MQYAKLSTAITISFGPVLDANGAEYTGAVVGDVKISKNSGTPAAINASATLTHKEVGVYELVLTASDISAVGCAAVTLSKTTYIAPPVRLVVLPVNVYDSIIGGSGSLGGATAEELAAAILADPTHKLATTAAGAVYVVAGNGSPILLYGLQGDAVYCQRGDIEDIYGVENVSKWADLNNDQDAEDITARIARAITVAAAEFEDLMRGGPYAIPVVASGSSAVTVTRLNATFAGVWLYESRGVSDMDADGTPHHRLAYQRREFEQVVKAIRAGQRRLEATLAGSGRGGNAPITVGSHRHR